MFSQTQTPVITIYGALECVVRFACRRVKASSLLRGQRPWGWASDLSLAAVRALAGTLISQTARILFCIGFFQHQSPSFKWVRAVLQGTLFLFCLWSVHENIFSLPKLIIYQGVPWTVLIYASHFNK